jgi:DNA segregation ATPase FtsK/SpoIIIE-like protein
LIAISIQQAIPTYGTAAIASTATSLVLTSDITYALQTTHKPHRDLLQSINKLFRSLWIFPLLGEIVGNGKGEAQTGYQL